MTFMVCEKCLCVPGLHSLAAVTESINLIHGHACAHALSTHPSFGTTSSLWWPRLSLPPPLPVLIWRRNLLGKSFGKNTTGSALLERDEVELHHSHHTGPTNLRGELVWDGGDLALHVVVGRQLQDEPGKIGPSCIACEGLQQNLGKRGEACYRVSFFTGPVLKVLSMELVPPNKEIDWFRHKSSKYGSGPTQEKKMTVLPNTLKTVLPLPPPSSKRSHTLTICI